ncbi:MAG: hypothetical protein LUD15_13230, partial [Bacteroides sp.]|nr:hypothetical protein [Bacteroides sp.]
YTGNPPVVTDYWNMLVSRYGKIDPSGCIKRIDYEYVDAAFLIENIEAAFTAWHRAPSFLEKEFDLFLEYILPYRAGSEKPEPHRLRLMEEFSHLLDSCKSVEEIIQQFHLELRWKRNFRESDLLWSYPLHLPVSKVELGKRGACHHLTNYTVNVMCSVGLPVTTDFAIWGNRNNSHAWNVLLLDKDNFSPFDALGNTRIELQYKPAKVFRQTYKNGIAINREIEDGPNHFLLQNDNYLDVTHLYCTAYDVKIPDAGFNGQEDTPLFICTFDNRNWQPVHSGELRGDTLCFENMAADIVYRVAGWVNHEILPVTEPFLLTEKGELSFFTPDLNKTTTLHLKRKYPRFYRNEQHAWGMRRANAEVSDDREFRDSLVLFSIYETPQGVTDSVVHCLQRYCYVRLNSSTYQHANFALVEFYGKKRKITRK